MIDSKIADTSGAIIGAATLLLASIDQVNSYLQAVVLILTIVFVALGCYLRARKIRGEGGGDGEE